MNFGSVKMELGAIVAWLALLISIISLGFTIYSRKYPPQPDFRIIAKSSKSSTEEFAKYQIFIRNNSNGDGILKFVGLSVKKPAKKNNEYYQLDNVPYQDKYYIFSGNSISQDIIEFEDDFVQGIIKREQSNQKYFYAVFSNENDDFFVQKIDVYMK